MSTSKMTLIVIAAFLLASATLTLSASAAVFPQLGFINGTADFSQGGFSPDLSVNGGFNDAGSNEQGWAIDNQEFSNHVAAWNTTSPIVLSTGSQIKFVIHHDFGFPNEVLGHFRLSVTTDSTILSGDDNETAHSLSLAHPSINDNSRTWTQLTPTSVSALLPSHSISIQGDNSILVSGTGNPEVLTVITNVPALSGAVTGIRLEALTFGASQGPGLAGGNFVVTELEAFVPEPSSLALLAVVGLMVSRFRRRTKADNKRSLPDSTKRNRRPR